MNNFLEQVARERLADAQVAAEHVPFEDLQREMATMTVRRSLASRLRTARTAKNACVIAEIKRASPSAGVLRDECNPVQIASVYEQSGAVGISMVTEPRYFKGRDEDVALVRAASRLPILRKDFITDPYQVYASASIGADVILLIAACLDFSLLRDLYIIALAIGLEVIVEVHNAEELEMVMPLAEIIIGVNSRNLSTLKVDLNVTRELGRLLPSDRPAIAESGIKTRHDIQELSELGYSGFLIGETLMRSSNPALMLRMLLGQPMRQASAG